jgi:hypothetical protein
MHVAAQAIELCDNNGRFGLASAFQSGCELRTALIIILAGLRRSVDRRPSWVDFAAGLSL